MIRGDFVLRSEALTGNLTIREFYVMDNGSILVRVTDMNSESFWIDSKLLEVYRA